MMSFLQVGHLVLANSDYVIDSICRQLRHLDLNPHVPNVLAAMLSYIGLAHKILPLLEEPVRLSCTAYQASFWRIYFLSCSCSEHVM